MRREFRLYLFDMLSAGETIQKYIDGKTLSDYLENGMLRDAVERRFEIIGEALTQARAIYPEIRNHISDHQDIVAFRNRVVHGYFGLDDSVIWSIAVDALPLFLEQVRGLLQDQSG